MHDLDAQDAFFCEGGNSLMDVRLGSTGVRDTAEKAEAVASLPVPGMPLSLSENYHPDPHALLDVSKAGFENTGATGSPVLPAIVDGSVEQAATLPETCQTPSLFRVPERHATSSNSEELERVPEGSAAGRLQYACEMEGGKHASYWSSSTAVPEAPTCLGGVSDGATCSASIDAVRCQRRAAPEGDSLPLSKDELHLLSGNLNHLLRAAAEEIRRLENMEITGATATEEVRQFTSRRSAEKSHLTAQGSTDRLRGAGSCSLIGTEAMPASSLSSAARECQTLNDADGSFDTNKHDPD